MSFRRQLIGYSRAACQVQFVAVMVFESIWQAAGTNRSLSPCSFGIAQQRNAYRGGKRFRHKD
jgi:hypothetical protein